MTDLKNTPLYDVHVPRGAKMVPFAGYRMPVQYTGVIAEHTAVRQHAGLFDVSHMGEVIIDGPEALVAIQGLVTNDISKLVDGRALYTVMCQEDGGIVDDLIIYRESESRYFVCVNASRREIDYAHMLKHTASYDCSVEDVSDRYAQIAIQGPKALGILAAQTKVDVLGMAPFSWVDGTVAGCANVRVAITGYTGEPGAELYCRPEDAPTVWQALEEAGANSGIALCGLGARDTLRLEMKYALYGNDIDEGHNPYEAGLGWVVKPAKGEFVGKKAICDAKAAGLSRKLVGIKMVGRGIPRQGYEVAHHGETCGIVTSGTHSPSLGEAIGLAYVPANLATIGTEVDVIIRGKSVAARVTKTPFYKREQA